MTRQKRVEDSDLARKDTIRLTGSEQGDQIGFETDAYRRGGVVGGRREDHHGEGRETLEAAMIGGEAEAHGGRGGRRGARVWRRKRSFAFWVGARDADGEERRDVRRKRGRVGSCADGSEARRRKKGTGAEERRSVSVAWIGPRPKQ